MMDKYEQFVCMWFLSEYDSSLSYAEIQDKLIHDDEDVIVWEPFEDMWSEDLCRAMDSLLEASRIAF